MQKCRKYEYDFMRLLLLCLVVLGHSCYNSLFYGVGGGWIIQGYLLAVNIPIIRFGQKSGLFMI